MIKIFCHEQFNSVLAVLIILITFFSSFSVLRITIFLMKIWSFHMQKANFCFSCFHRKAQKHKFSIPTSKQMSQIKKKPPNHTSKDKKTPALPETPNKTTWAKISFIREWLTNFELLKLLLLVKMSLISILAPPSCALCWFVFISDFSPEVKGRMWSYRIFPSEKRFVYLYCVQNSCLGRWLSQVSAPFTFLMK